LERGRIQAFVREDCHEAKKPTPRGQLDFHLVGKTTTPLRDEERMRDVCFPLKVQPKRSNSSSLPLQ
jgi:hypothetical protein